jgi:hypothetical protein
LNKKIAITQSNYIPWKGYFDLINSVDEFVLYDDAQYTKRDWRNRNLIKTNHGLKWLTIPVRQERFVQKIRETRVIDMHWLKKHWASISQNYSKSKHFDRFRNQFEEIYFSLETEFLSDINFRFISEINNILGIETRLSWSRDYELVSGKTERLIAICKQCNANVYLSGPAAKDYFDVELARKAGIEVQWVDYKGYPEYTQLYPPFEHSVSILDLLFNTGSDACHYMKSF